jgi:hypothetical protein
MKIDYRYSSTPLPPSRLPIKGVASLLLSSDQELRPPFPRLRKRRSQRFRHHMISASRDHLISAPAIT